MDNERSRSTYLCQSTHARPSVDDYRPQPRGQLGKSEQLGVRQTSRQISVYLNEGLDMDTYTENEIGDHDEDWSSVFWHLFIGSL